MNEHEVSKAKGTPEKTLAVDNGYKQKDLDSKAEIAHEKGLDGRQMAHKEHIEKASMGDKWHISNSTSRRPRWETNGTQRAHRKDLDGEINGTLKRP